MFKKRPSSAAAASEEAKAYHLGYVEPLSDARTRLETFFNILLGSWVELDKALADGQDRCLCTIVDLQLVENIAHVILDGFLAQIQVVGDLLIRLAVRHEA